MALKWNLEQGEDAEFPCIVHYASGHGWRRGLISDDETELVRLTLRSTADELPLIARVPALVLDRPFNFEFLVWKTSVDSMHDAQRLGWAVITVGHPKSGGYIGVVNEEGRIGTANVDTSDCDLSWMSEESFWCITVSCSGTNGRRSGAEKL